MITLFFISTTVLLAIIAVWQFGAKFYWRFKARRLALQIDGLVKQRDEYLTDLVAAKAVGKAAIAANFRDEWPEYLMEKRR